ncbi:TauD/TfdA dioxygenase family protein [Bradyrhizobium cytisi]|uniref:TauD/TfdA family dioxygenase n=1 Tax=Bradyrhizobium cytisi TaxID=515489 RepID=A0A5S4W3C9_9BRAD|nr:TauD/TfdA family dioxygenase [Bradyrhizobium cytisi]TYL72208.1 TauD/TfdA family dioxygenase [Bradyrhizobium cytisi]
MIESATIDSIIPAAKVVRRAKRLGAEINNLKLSSDLPEEIIEAINQLLLEHRVLFFRNQDHLHSAEQEQIAARLGKLIPHPTVFEFDGAPSLLQSRSGQGDGRVDEPDRDFTFDRDYQRISLMRDVPPNGGDIIWSNTAAAYLGLPLPLRRFADDLWVVHGKSDDVVSKTKAAEVERNTFAGPAYERKYPLVQVLPETGERCLMLGKDVRQVVGLQRYTSQKLLGLFHSYVTAPKNVVQWNWRAGDLAVWDNRVTQHYPVNDQHPFLCRVTNDGDLPLSANNHRSVKRGKQSSSANVA